jgi:hypothetical protein
MEMADLVKNPVSFVGVRRSKFGRQGRSAFVFLEKGRSAFLFQVLIASGKH